MTRILVIEDDRDIADFVRRGLIYKDYEVDVQYDGEAGLTYPALNHPPDLVLLESDDPESGRRRSVSAPACREQGSIIILTARDSVTDKISGLDAGADDYVTKPFAFDELLARVRAHLRRKEPEDEVIQVGDLTIRPASRDYARRTAESSTSREFDLLLFLARNAGKVMDRNTIFERVWGYTFDVESDTIKVYIRYLRRS